MKLGVIQGRLSSPNEGFQECPKSWHTEFEKLKKIGLSHIEWIVTQKSFSHNPIFFENVKGYPVHSICADNLVSQLVDDEKFLNHNLVPICDTAIRNNIECVTIPLLEDSSVESDSKLIRFSNIFSRIARKYSSIKFSLETELSIDKIPALLEISDNVCLTYDTGNTTSYGLSHGEYINRFADRISNEYIFHKGQSNNSDRI